MSAARGRTEAPLRRRAKSWLRQVAVGGKGGGGNWGLARIPSSSCWPASLLCFDEGRVRGLAVRGLGRLAPRGHIVTLGPPNCRPTYLDRHALVRRAAAQLRKDLDAPHSKLEPGRCPHRIRDFLRGRPCTAQTPRGGSRFRRLLRRGQQRAPCRDVRRPHGCRISVQPGSSLLSQPIPVAPHRLPWEGILRGFRLDRRCK